MKFNIIRNKTARLFDLCMMACVLCVSCMDDSNAEDMYYEDMQSAPNNFGQYGTYEGNWTLDGQDAGTGVMTVYPNYITFDTLPQETIVRRVSDIKDFVYEPVKYTVNYFLTGSSTDTYYFTLESNSYEYSIKVGDNLAPVNVKMSTLYSDLPNAIYNKGTLVAMLKISKIVTQTENEETVVSNFEPALVLMFNPVKRIK